MMASLYADYKLDLLTLVTGRTAQPGEKIVREATLRAGEVIGEVALLDQGTPLGLGLRPGGMPTRPPGLRCLPGLSPAVHHLPAMGGDPVFELVHG